MSLLWKLIGGVCQHYNQLVFCWVGMMVCTQWPKAMSVCVWCVYCAHTACHAACTVVLWGCGNLF